MRLRYKIYKTFILFEGWAPICDEAAEFATRLGPDRVVSVSHSYSHRNASVIVWYWAEDGLEAPEDE